MRIVSEGGRTWGVIENPLRDPPFHKTYVDLTQEDVERLLQHALTHQLRVEIERKKAHRSYEMAVARRTQPHTEEPHGRTCTCFPCEQANERMDRDDPSVGGYVPDE